MTDDEANSTAPPVRYVVLHTPGPAWRRGLDFRQQKGVPEHVAHYRKLHEEGKLEMGGPFLVPDTGGMMVPIKGVGQEEIEAFAAADPAVHSGVLRYEVRPWYTAIERVK